jgi:hypothetical protein
MPIWMSTLVMLLGYLMLFVGLSGWSIHLAFAVCGALLIVAGVMAE